MFKKNSGFSLIDVLVGVALMLIVFVGISAAFSVAVNVAGISRLRAGAVALANDKMESIKNLPYDDVGTLGGIPTGNIPQSEIMHLNGVDYTCDTLIQYIDDPADGEGDDDENGITADYKRVRVEIGWENKNTAESVVFVSDIVPKSMETTAGGGTLKINVFDASILPVAGAIVEIENDSVDPAVSIFILTNFNGKVILPGAPAGSNYKITVSKTGYSTTQTYDATPENPNPQPGNLTIIEGETAEASFSIDLLSSDTIKTYVPADSYTWTDSFSNESKISATSSTEITGGEAVLKSTPEEGYPSSGYIISKTITPSELNQWTEFSWSDSKDASTTIKYQVLYFYSSSWQAVPDSDLPGNSSEFETSPVNLTSLASTTYPEIRLKADFSTIDASETPALSDWQVSWESGRVPLPSLSFSMRGDKITGTDESSNPIYKYSEDLTTDSEGVIDVAELEWDNYLITVNGAATGYDISEICPFQPASLPPGTDATTDIVLVPHTNNTFLVSVEDNSGNFVPGVLVRLQKTGYDKTLETSYSCGQTFFSPLSASANYTIEATKAGYQDFSLSNVNVSGQTKMNIVLSPL